MEKTIPIRAISRAIVVLQVINRKGSTTQMEVARAAGLPYPTVGRIIQTLIYEGLVECEPLRKRYRPTRLVETLSLGYRDHDRLIQLARPHIVELTKRVKWPVTISTAVGQSVMVRDSTYALSALTFNHYYPGYTFPILECAAGHVHLAFSDDDTRECILQGMKDIGASSLVLDMFLSGKLTHRIRHDGFAINDRTQHTANPGKTSSIAVPILEHGYEVAELTMSYFAPIMSPTEAARQFVDILKETAATIGTLVNRAADETLAPTSATAPDDIDAPRPRETIGV